MAKRVKVVGANPKRVKVADEPKRRIDPAELAAQLGADPNGKHLGANLDPIALAELGNELLRRLRSTGGRPALDDATEICRVPLSAEDLKTLETITDEIAANTGAKPSAGQLASVIVRHYLRSGLFGINESRDSENQIQNNAGNSTPDWLLRLNEIAEQAGVLHKAADEIELAAKEIGEGLPAPIS